MKKTLLLLLLTGSLAAPAFAGAPAPSEVIVPPPPPYLYRAGEFQLDVFGLYGFTDSGDEALLGDDAFGGGLGFNYFLTRHLGIGAEISLFDTDGDTLGTTAFNVIFRLPVGETGFAVYTFAGIGLTFNADDLDYDDFDDASERIRDNDDPRDTDDVLLQGYVGLGVEYRFNPNLGIFSDARYTWVESDHSDFAQIRVGLRFVF